MTSDCRHFYWLGLDDVRVADIYGSEPRVVHGHRQRVSEIRYSPDGRLLVSRGDRGHLCFWDADNDELLYETTQFASGYAFCPNGQWFAVATNNEIQLYRTSDATLLGIVKLDFTPRFLSADPAGRFLATSHDRGLVICKINLSEPTGQSPLADQAAGTASASIQVLRTIGGLMGSYAWSPDGSQIAYLWLSRATGGKQQIYIENVEDSEDGFLLTESEPAQANFNQGNFQFVSDSRLLLLNDRHLELWDLNSKQLLTRDSAESNGPMALSPDGGSVATANRIVRVDDFDDFIELPLWNNIIWSVDWSPDGRTVAFGMDQGDIVIWNLQAVENRLKEHELGSPAADFQDVAASNSIGDLISLFRSMPPVDITPRFRPSAVARPLCGLGSVDAASWTRAGGQRGRRPFH